MTRAKKGRGRPALNGPAAAPRPEAARMVRMRAPDGVTSVSLGGREHAVKDGSVEVPDHLAETLASHGFTRV
jgi:hypothetical protein